MKCGISLSLFNQNGLCLKNLFSVFLSLNEHKNHSFDLDMQKLKAFSLTKIILVFLSLKFQIDLVCLRGSFLNVLQDFVTAFN